MGGAAAHLLTGHVNSDIRNGRIMPDAPPAQLYDLAADPQQKENLYNEFPEVVAELRALLENALSSKENTRLP